VTCREAEPTKGTGQLAGKGSSSGESGGQKKKSFIENGIKSESHETHARLNANSDKEQKGGRSRKLVKGELGKKKGLEKPSEHILGEERRGNLVGKKGGEKIPENQN